MALFIVSLKDENAEDRSSFCILEKGLTSEEVRVDYQNLGYLVLCIKDAEEGFADFFEDQRALLSSF